MTLGLGLARPRLWLRALFYLKLLFSLQELMGEQFHAHFKVLLSLGKTSWLALVIIRPRVRRSQRQMVQPRGLSEASASRLRFPVGKGLSLLLLVLVLLLGGKDNFL